MSLEEGLHARLETKPSFAQVSKSKPTRTLALPFSRPSYHLFLYSDCGKNPCLTSQIRHTGYLVVSMQNPESGHGDAQHATSPAHSTLSDLARGTREMQNEGKSRFIVQKLRSRGDARFIAKAHTASSNPEVVRTS